MLKSSSPILGWACLASFAWGGLACAGETPPKPGLSSPTTAASLISPIKALIGDAACDDSAQCHSIGVGSKPCGGPAGYLAWSSKLMPDPSALRSAVAIQAQAQREEDRRAGMNSTCVITPDPGARCVPTPSGGQCQLNTGAAAGAQ